jgi:hypothetical protein
VIKHPRIFAAIALTSIAWLAAAQHSALAPAGLPVILSDSCAGSLAWYAPGLVRRVEVSRQNDTELSFLVEFTEKDGTSTVGWEHDFGSPEAREFAIAECEKDLRVTQGMPR